MNCVIKEKAKRIWELEKQGGKQAEQEILNIMDSCSIEDLFLIDEYIFNHYNNES